MGAAIFDLQSIVGYSKYMPREFQFVDIMEHVIESINVFYLLPRHHM